LDIIIILILKKQIFLVKWWVKVDYENLYFRDPKSVIVKVCQ